MSQKLISHNPDLKRLQDEGYQMEVCGGYLCIHHIPYLNAAKEPKLGTLVTNLELAGDNVLKPKDHVMLFAGEFPHYADGRMITGLRHGEQRIQIDDSLFTSYSFSNKPPEGFSNYYDKVISYVRIISHQAIAVDSSLTATPFLPVIDKTPETVFHYVDTNSSRANINAINAKLNGHKVAIIGLGGTGAYVLDLVSKTQVAEIHIFDGDQFLVHNAFRSPGAASLDDLNAQKQKCHYYYDIYSKMHKGIQPHNYYVTEENLHELKQCCFVFICIDNNNARKTIIEYLMKEKVAFVDVGMGIYAVDDQLIGCVRTTVGTPEKTNHLAGRIPMGEDDDNDYTTNIQIAEMNCLNATLAVIRWKKWVGFYQDYEQEFHSTYSINVAQLLNEDLQVEA